MEFMHDRGAFLSYIYHHCHCINAGQSQGERRLKYAIAKSLGKCSYDARVLRDYRTSAFAKYFGYTSWKSVISFQKGEE